MSSRYGKPREEPTITGTATGTRSATAWKNNNTPNDEDATRCTYGWMFYLEQVVDSMKDGEAGSRAGGRAPLLTLVPPLQASVAASVALSAVAAAAKRYALICSVPV